MKRKRYLILAVLVAFMSLCLIPGCSNGSGDREIASTGTLAGVSFGVID